MIVAGIGCRKGASEREVMEALTAALAAQHLGLPVLGAIATASAKRAEPAIADTARRLGLPLSIVEDGALHAAADRCLTVSERSLAFSGAPSLSEAAALAVAGDGARLLAPRLVLGSVTCALAASPSPLVGEGGSARSAETDEGSGQDHQRLVPSSTPHPPSLTAASPPRSGTFSHKGRRKDLP